MLGELSKYAFNWDQILEEITKETLNKIWFKQEDFSEKISQKRKQIEELWWIPSSDFELWILKSYYIKLLKQHYGTTYISGNFKSITNNWWEIANIFSIISKWFELWDIVSDWIFSWKIMSFCKNWFISLECPGKNHWKVFSPIMLEIIKKEWVETVQDSNKKMITENIDKNNSTISDLKIFLEKQWIINEFDFIALYIGKPYFYWNFNSTKDWLESIKDYCIQSESINRLTNVKKNMRYNKLFNQLFPLIYGKNIENTYIDILSENYNLFKNSKRIDRHSTSFVELIICYKILKQLNFHSTIAPHNMKHDEYWEMLAFWKEKIT